MFMNAMNFFMVVGLCVLTGLPAQAQTVNEIDRLSFGTFAVRKNNTTASLTITPENNVMADNAFVVDQEPVRGHYILSDLPPNVPFYLGVEVPNSPAEGGITLEQETPASAGGGAAFSLQDLTIGDGGVMQSDGAGEAEVYIGGTLRTSGNGQRYDGGYYSGTYTFTIHY